MTLNFHAREYMMKLIEKGYQVYYIVATNGESGFKLAHKPRNERIAIRHKEQLSAAKMLGVKKVYFLGYKDGFLPHDDGLRKKLVKIIKEVQAGNNIFIRPR